MDGGERWEQASHGLCNFYHLGSSGEFNPVQLPTNDLLADLDNLSVAVYGGLLSTPKPHLLSIRVFILRYVQGGALFKKNGKADDLEASSGRAFAVEQVLEVEVIRYERCRAPPFTFSFASFTQIQS